MTKLHDGLIERKYKSAHTLRGFVQTEITASAGKCGEAVKLLAKLLEISEDARARMAEEYVHLVHEELRAGAAKARDDAKWGARQNRREEIHAKVEPALHAIEALSAQDCQKYENFVWNWKHLNGKEKRALKGFCRKLGLDYKEWGDGEWRRVLKALKWRCDDERREREEREEQNRLEADERKIAAFDRMVMALDALRVGNKSLGDCTGGDLLREAARLEALANQVTAQSVFYRQLAAIVGKVATVREASDRAGIVGLLTSRYREEERMAAE